MHKWKILLVVAATGLAVLLFAINDWPMPEHSSLRTTQLVPLQDLASRSAEASRVRSPQILSGIDIERKRRIVNAASACAKVDSFREMAAAVAGPASSNPLAGLSDVQRRNFERVEEQCSTDSAARTAPVDEFLADLARSGNMAAAACYAFGGIRSQLHGVPPPNDANYRQLVPELIERGVAAGDWTMVSLAGSVNSPRRAGSPFTYLPPPEPKLEYRYIKLLELGANSEEKADLQMVLAELAKNLSHVERNEAEVAAKSLFNAHFIHSGPYRHGSQPLCMDF